VATGSAVVANACEGWGWFAVVSCRGAASPVRVWGCGGWKEKKGGVSGLGLGGVPGCVVGPGRHEDGRVRRSGGSGYVWGHSAD